MEQYVTRAIEALIFPPGIFLVLLVAGTLLINNRPLLAKSVLYISIITFYLFSTPFIADLLISHVEAYPTLEDKSRTTSENALFSKRFLAKKQIDTILLVTQAWHMTRSVAVFEKVGLNVIPAPTAFEGGKPSFKLLDVLPSARALNMNRYALHEIVGAFWYMVRY